MTDDAPRTLTIQQALQIALAAQREGNHERAASIHAQILTQDPDNGDALHLGGTLEIDRGNLDEAERKLRRAVDLHPGIAAFKASLARALHRMGRAEEALGYAARALADDPGNQGIREVANHILRVEPTVDLLGPPRPLRAMHARPAPPPVSEDCLVIGLATGYPAAALRPFVDSLRAHYQGPVHLFVDDDAEIRAFLSARGVAASLAEAGGAHPVISRFAAYRGLVETLTPRTRVLLTDVSDVIFQGNPFAFSVNEAAGGPGFIAVLEDASQSLGTCPWNSEWLRAHFGTRMLDRLARGRISCIGTIFGDRNGLREYLNQFLLLAASLPVPGVYGLDTAIHNVILHHATVSTPAALENGWPVATVQHMPESAIVVKDTEIQLADGRRPLVVHQYNRRGPMLALVAERYGGP